VQRAQLRPAVGLIFFVLSLPMKGDNKLRISIVGTGNVATHLAEAIAQSEHELVYIISRDLSRANQLAERFSAEGKTDVKLTELDIDILIFAVKDEALKADFFQNVPKNVILCHTSGSISMEVLQGHQNYGIFYPLQTFSKQKELNFQDIPICLEASSKEVMQKLHLLASSISDKVYEVNSKQRKALHVAAVFACNFSNLMYQIANDICIDEELDFDILRPLIKETAAKVQEHRPYEVQTGPAKRNDLKVLNLHRKYLEKKPDYQEIYNMLTYQIRKNNEEL